MCIQNTKGTEPIFFESLFMNNTAEVFGGGLVLMNSTAILVEGSSGSTVRFRENTVRYKLIIFIYMIMYDTKYFITYP